FDTPYDTSSYNRQRAGSVPLVINAEHPECHIPDTRLPSFRALPSRTDAKPSLPLHRPLYPIGCEVDMSISVAEATILAIVLECILYGQYFHSTLPTLFGDAILVSSIITLSLTRLNWVVLDLPMLCHMATNSHNHHPNYRMDVNRCYWGLHDVGTLPTDTGECRRRFPAIQDMGRFTTAFVTNLIATSILALMLWLVHRRSLEIRVTRSQVYPIMRIIVESGAMCSISLVTMLAAYLSASNSAHVVTDMFCQVIPINFFLIIVRTAMLRFSDRTGQGLFVHTLTSNHLSAPDAMTVHIDRLAVADDILVHRLRFVQLA
ncbi:hypothetical protein AZE42_01555, partial [Rhizopogon vesiculosus]